jgi:DNA-directed RNA polymerase subunit RPC12/RpoP
LYLQETYFGYGTGYDTTVSYEQPMVEDEEGPLPPFANYNMGTFTNYTGLGMDEAASSSAMIENDNGEMPQNEESILVESTDDEDEDGPEPSNSADWGQHGYNCSECGHSFWTPKDLVKHWDVHTSSADEGDPMANQLLIDITSERPITRKMIHKCRECKRQFNHESGHRSLLRHIRTMHSSGKKPYTMTKKPYVRPITTEATADPDKEYDFNCDICPAKYTNIGSLRSHKRKHEKGNENFDCSTCGKEFQSQSGRTLHVQKYHMNLMHECR